MCDSPPWALPAGHPPPPPALGNVGLSHNYFDWGAKNLTLAPQQS